MGMAIKTQSYKDIQSVSDHRSVAAKQDRFAPIISRPDGLNNLGPIPLAFGGPKSDAVLLPPDPVPMAAQVLQQPDRVLEGQAAIVKNGEEEQQHIPFLAFTTRVLLKRS